MNTHENYMRIAIELAKKAEGMTSPNPIVGAVIVKNGKIIGRGYHKKAGLPHAEVNALREAGQAAEGAILYVTLEPCNHFGRTGPCTDAIIKIGIKKVFIGMIDPNPINNGRGMARLKKAGIETRVSILKTEARSMNAPYIKFITKRMPYITIKVAESLDGKIATKSGESKWISSEDSRRYVHSLRAKADAVMVGVNTAIKDNPSLLSGVSAGRQPMRIIVDELLRIPISARVFSTIEDAPVIIATVKNTPKVKKYEKAGAKVLVVGEVNGMVDLKKLLKILARRNITNILCEGGGELNASLIEGGLADKLLFFIAPKIIGGRSAITSVEGGGVNRIADAVLLRNLNVRKIKEDILIEADIR